MKTQRPAYALCYFPERPSTYVRYNNDEFRHLKATLCIIEDKRPRWFDFGIDLTAQAGGGSDFRQHKFYAFKTEIECCDSSCMGHIGNWFCRPYDEMHKIITKWNKRECRFSTWAEFVAAFMETVGIDTLIYDLKGNSTWETPTYEIATGMKVMQVLMKIEADTLEQLYPPEKALHVVQEAQA